LIDLGLNLQPAIGSDYTVDVYSFHVLLRSGYPSWTEYIKFNKLLSVTSSGRSLVACTLVHNCTDVKKE